MFEYDVDLAERTIRRTAAHFVKVNPYLLFYYELDDLTQEVFAHFLEKEFFQKYDGRTSFQYFVARAAKNHLIDLTRKRILKMLSLNQPVYGSEGTEDAELGDFVKGSLSDQYSMVLLKQILDNCPENQVSPNYSLSWKELLFMIMEGFTPTEIRKKVNVSSARVVQIKGNLIRMLQQEVN